ncbi:unnamed protein product [Cuscuta campestris]|uniref:K Homology domain-containing protein n=1 Tax=Cuscuta campestris TaxID=132261 RepID=A0A484MSN8_9ASTE|nr:unnamed protein product [Cuscuta campestris]
MTYLDDDSSMGGQRSGHGKRSHSNSEHADNGTSKRRNSGGGGGGGGGKEHFSIDPKDTVYRYLCPGKNIGSIIGRGGEIVKQLRADTKSKIRIGETVRDCDERVVTIYSSSEETNDFEGTEDRVCPAQDALFKVHDRIVGEDLSADEESEDGPRVTARLLVPSDQIGCIIGKGGQIVQDLRSETGAQIRILKDNHLPACALTSDELVQISGDTHVVKKALYKISARLHDNPSRSQHTLASASSSAYPSGGGSLTGAPLVGLAPLVGPYGGYRGGESGDWSRALYTTPRDQSHAKEFSLCLICPNANIGGVIGKGGVIIKQIREESRALIKVDSAAAEGDDCLITISAKEFFEDTYSPTVEAAVRLQPRCSEQSERDSGLISFTTRLLVPTSRIGCLLGKGGSIINEMRRMTKANIRILSKEHLPKVAAEDDEMVLISGDLNVSKDALLQVTSRLRANLFGREGAVSAVVPVLPYLPMSADDPSRSIKYESKDSRRHGHSYPGDYGGLNDPPHYSDSYRHYGGVHSNSSSSVRHGAYEGYHVGRSGSSGLSGSNSESRRRSYGY